MADKKDLFEGSPDTVELKGKVTGVTRLSKKAKALMSMGAMVLLGFIVFSIYTVDTAEDPTTVAQQEQDDKQKKGGMEPAKPGDAFAGVSDGQASHEVPAESPIDPDSPNAIGPGVKLPAPSGNALPPASPQRGGGLAPEVSPQVPAPSAQPMSAEQQAVAQLKQQREQAKAQARGAEIEVGGGGFSGASASPTALAGMQGLLQQAPSLLGGAGTGSGQTGLGGGNGGQQQDDQNKQVRKEAFLKEAENQPDKSYLKEVKRAPVSKYEIKTGWAIPAVLESGINSDLPGQVCARVRENVHDSRTGLYLLIPQGTKACGHYDSQIAVGQTRLLLAWNRLIFEDGSSISLQGMPGTDQAGYAGFDGDVDNHYLRLFGGAVMMTIISASAQLSQPKQTASTVAAPTMGQTMAGALGQQLGEVGTQMAQRNLQIQPTIKQAPGYRFNIMVTRDIVFPGVHRSN